MSGSTKKKRINKDQSKEALPKKPSLQVLKQSEEEMENFDATRTDYQINIDAIAGLAFIENVKSGQTKDQFNKKGWNDQDDDSDAKSKKDKTHLKLVNNHDHQESKFGLKTFLYIAIIAGSIYGTFLLLNSANSPTKIVKVEKEEKKEFKTVTPKRVYKARNQNTAKTFRKRERRKQRNIRRAPAATSFRESQVFKKHKVRKLEDNPVKNEDGYENDDYYKDDYDDGSEPIENDLVRSKTSKEIINPDNDYFDEEERDLYDENGDRRSPASKKEEKTWVNSANDDSEYSDYDDEEVEEENIQEEEMPFEDAEDF